MPQFVYRAKDASLNIVEGAIEADTEEAAISRLGSQGVFPISIVESESAPNTSPVVLAGSSRVSTQTLAYTTRQLADLLGGGLPLLSALNLLSKQTESRVLQRIVESLANSVRDGRSLSEALSAYPSVFPPLYISMVKAGEVGGVLEQVLVRLAELGEHEAELKSRVVSAAAYPIVVLVVALGMTIFLMMYVVPNLSLVFLESGQLLPLPTRILLAVSNALMQWGWALVIAIIVTIWALRSWSLTKTGRAAIDSLLMALPGVGVLVRKFETARVTRNLGVMIHQGVQVLQALDVTSDNVGNIILRRAVSQIEASVRDGSSLASALGATKQFPLFVSNMVAIGEESGTVDSALLKVSATYEREADRTLRMLTTILEPVLLLAVGGIVMFIVLAMLLPVFQLGLVVQ